MEDRELSRVRFLTANFAALQGLKVVPFGVVLLVEGLTVQYTSPFRSGTLLGPAFFCLFVIGMIALHRQIARTYERTFGRVEARPRPPGTLLGVLGLVPAVYFVLCWIEFRLNSPVSLFGLLFSLAIAWPYLRSEARPYWRYRGIVGGVIALLSLLPALSDAPAVEFYGRHGAVSYMDLVLTVWGLALVVIGVLDHLTLLSVLHPASEAS